MNSFSIEGYRLLIQAFIDAGYCFRFFDDGLFEENTVYLRHDVDFSPRYALRIAEEEKKLNVKSTYFIQMDSSLYNPFEFDNQRSICTIYELGHSICLHIDETKLENMLKFEMYARAFRVFFPYANINVISRHRPNLELPIPWMDKSIIDVYSKPFFEDIEYASDSRCEWTYGYPLERESFKDKKSFQLLTHPFWWCGSGEREERIKNWLREEEIHRIDSNMFISNFLKRSAL